MDVYDPIVACIDCGALMHASEIKWRLKLKEDATKPMVSFYAYEEICVVCFGGKIEDAGDANATS